MVPFPGTPESNPGQDVPGSLGWTYVPGQGVWKDGRKVLEWCPTVTRHLVTHTARGTLAARKVTIRIGDQETTVPLGDVADGSVWTNRFPVAGVGTRTVREVLRNIVDDQAARLPLLPTVPRWVDGRLTMPPADVLPAGYLVVSGTDEEWRTLLREVARSPRMALFVGLAVGGLYVRPLGRQSYTCHLPGASSEGKTTTMQAAAAVFGDPQNSVIKPWAATTQGIPTMHRALGTLTAFRDELGSSNFKGEKLSQQIFFLMEGCERDRSDKSSAGLIESPGSWRGALMSTGNESIVGQIDNEGIAARVIEMEGPFTLDADHADQIKHTTATVHGHGLAAIVERGWTPQQFARVADALFAQIGNGTEKVERRVAWHLTMGAAGAVMLAELSGVPELAADVVDTARRVLAEQSQGLAERGARPGDRLIALVADWVASNPAGFPTRKQHAEVLNGDALLREVFGWDLRDDEPPGEIAIIPTKLREYAARQGVTDLTIALKGLRKDGRLVPGAKELTRVVNVSGASTRAYVFSGLWPESESTADSAPESPAPDPDPAPPAPARTEGKLETLAPCAGCGEPSGWQRGGIPLHAGCDLPRPVPPPAPEPVQESLPSEVPATPPPPSAPSTPVEQAAPSTAPRASASSTTRPAPVGALAVAADIERLYLDSGEILDPGDAYADMGAFLARVVALMPSGGSVAITAELAAMLGYPDKPVSTLTGRKLTQAMKCRALTAATGAGWQHSKAGTGAWTTFYGEGRPNVAVLVIEWTATDTKTSEDKQLVTSQDSAERAAYKLGRFRSLVGTPYALSSGTACTNLLKETRERQPRGKRITWKWPGTDTIPAGVMTKAIVWQRPPTDEERQASHVIGWDARMAYLGALTSAELAADPLTHTGFDGEFDKSRAGYWLVSAGAGELFPMLPDLTGGGGQEMWVPTPIAALLIRHGMPQEAITDAILAPGRASHSIRLGRPVAERIRDVLAGLPKDGPDGEIRRVVKAMYSEGVGMLRRDLTRVYRRDWADTIIGAANMSLLSKLIHIGERTGRWPLKIDTDCAYYATVPGALPLDNPGFIQGESLGQFSLKSIQPMDEFLAGGKR